MQNVPLSTNAVLGFIEEASTQFAQSKDSARVLEGIKGLLLAVHQADAMEVRGPFLTGGPSHAQDVRHVLREGCWVRELVLKGARRDDLAAQRLAQILIDMAQARLQSLLERVTLEADLEQATRRAAVETAEAGQGHGLVQDLDWAIDRADRSGTAVALFRLALDPDLPEQTCLDMASRLKAVLRRVDRVTRLDSHQIVLVLEGLVAPDSVGRVEERMLRQFFGQSVAFHAGVALYPCHAKSPERLMACSEYALHESRLLGVRGFHHYGAAAPLTSLQENG